MLSGSKQRRCAEPVGSGAEHPFHRERDREQLLLGAGRSGQLQRVIGETPEWALWAMAGLIAFMMFLPLLKR